MAYSNTWDETAPAGTDAIASGDDEIRQFKLDIRERLNSLLASTSQFSDNLDPLLLGESLTQGDGEAEDLIYILDGNAQDYYFGLDDSSDDFIIGLGNTMGTTPALHIDENQRILIAAAAATVDGQCHIVSSSTGTPALIVEMPSGASANALELHLNGVQYIRFQMTSGICTLNLGGAIDLGDDVAGPQLFISRNNTSSNPHPGTLVFIDQVGNNKYYWADQNGLLRYNDCPPSGGCSIGQFDGTVVGDQSSRLRNGNGNLLKNLGDLATPEEGLANVLKTQYWHYTYVNGKYNNTEFVGTYAEVSPHLMQDKGRAFSSVNASSFNSLAIQALHDRITQLERRVN